MRYFDASALAKRYVDEDGSARVRRLLADGDAVTSRYSLVEVISAVARKQREGLLSSDETEAIRAELQRNTDHMVIVEVTPAIVDQAQALLFAHALRAGDALQLSSCLVLRRSLGRPVEFVCGDARLNAAAVAEGLEPGT